MKKRYPRKLVRDRIPELIQGNGFEYKVRKLRSKEFDAALMKKLQEEVGELIEAKGKKESLLEIADVMDVIEEIIRRKQLTMRDVQTAQKRSYEKKGGFEECLFLEWTSDDQYKNDDDTYAS